MPPILESYCLSICSADFNSWTRKVAATDERFSFMYSIEWEMPYFNEGSTFDYAEMTYLMLPRPFMVERGHWDRWEEISGWRTSTQRSRGSMLSSSWPMLRKLNIPVEATPFRDKAHSGFYTNIWPGPIETPKAGNRKPGKPLWFGPERKKETSDGFFS